MKSPCCLEKASCRLLGLKNCCCEAISCWSSSIDPCLAFGRVFSNLMFRRACSCSVSWSSATCRSMCHLNSCLASCCVSSVGCQQSLSLGFDSRISPCVNLACLTFLYPANCQCFHSAHPASIRYFPRKNISRIFPCQLESHSASLACCTQRCLLPFYSLLPS